MITLLETKKNIISDQKNWSIYLMDFVDDFRYYKNPDVIEQSFDLNNEKFDALLASTVMYLCDELNLECPDWIHEVPSCKEPWFVSGMENLKAIALAESPIQFRIRKIFVLENFLHRA